MYKKIACIVLFTALSLTVQYAQSQLEKGLTVINKNNLQSRLAFLSSDWFEGREATTRGARMAADYLASLYQMLSMEPAGDDSSYFQQVPLAIVGTPATATLKINTPVGSTLFHPNHDFTLQPQPISQSIDGELAWAGYGFDESPKNRGKIIIRLAGLPLNATKEQKELSLMQQQIAKNKKAEDAAIAAILEYDPNDPFLKKESTAKQSMDVEKPTSGIYSHRYWLAEEVKAQIPVIKISKNVLQQLVSNSDAQIKSFRERGIVPTISGKASIEITAQTSYKDCRNVIAFIKGGELPDEVIVVGAHYDHLGSYNGFIWNGADDNASGAIGVTTIAQAFIATGIRPKRTVIFANWTAEERGLLGSRYFVNHFKNSGKIIYYHNYDMIGRSYDSKKSDMNVSLLYTDTWEKARTLSDHFNKTHNLGLNIQFSAWDKPTSGSDNASFAAQGIPIMWYHTGGHPDYHMPSDHAEYIDWQKLEAIVKNSFLTLWELANE